MSEPMSASVEHILSFPGGSIVYDASRLRKAHAHLFDRRYWRELGALTEVSGGRGSVCFLRTDAGRWVLRHYRRGGLIARFSADRYLWLGAARTRSFAEWRLLAELRRRGLPVPAPIAAGYVRTGLTYRADLITAELPGARTLAHAMADAKSAPLSADGWRDIGRTIAAFHVHGVHHADLNAHNILLTDAGDPPAVHIIDFDRGRIRARGAWEQQVLGRLRRSLEKVGRQRGIAFADEQWRWLIEGTQSLRA